MHFKLHTVFNFGKYKGKTLKQVIDDDINYVVWCLSDIADFRMDNDSILHFINNKDNIFINHSHLNQEPMNALWEELGENKQIYSSEEINAKWNKAIAQILKK